MGVALWLAAGQLQTAFGGGLLVKSAALVLLVGGGMLLFGVVALLLGATDRADLARFRRRSAPPPAA